MSDKILIIMSDNRDINTDINSCDYNTLTSIINYDYCLKHGYDFIYLLPTLGGEKTLYNCVSPNKNPRHASWSKILSSIKVLDNDFKYDYIVYLDSDCIFNNFDITIVEYLKTMKTYEGNDVNLNSQIFFMNSKPWSEDLPCAGFYIFKQTDECKLFFKDWYNNTNEKFNILHPWEQITIQFELTEKNKSIIEVIDDWMFREKHNQFLRHIGSEESHNRIPFFKNIIKSNYTDRKVNTILFEIKKNIIIYDTNEIITI